MPIPELDHHSLDAPGARSALLEFADRIALEQVIAARCDELDYSHEPDDE